MSLTLASSTLTRYAILTPANADEAVLYAAEELKSFLFRMSGAAFPIVTAVPEGEHRVIRLDCDPSRMEALGEEGFAVRVCEQCGEVTLSGATPRAVLYAAYDLLERLGCRFFTATNQRVPKRSTLTVEGCDYTSKPALEYREPFYTEAYDGTWAARNKVNGQHMTLTKRQGGKVSYGLFVHTFNVLMPPSVYGAEHPEYYAEVDGKRLTEERTQLCLTNPDVLRICTENLRKEILAHPEARIFSISQNDWFNPCTCEKCRAIDEAEGSHAGTLLRFVNAIAEALEPEFPDIWFDTLAYQYTRPAPKLTRPRHNVIVRLCSIECCFTHPLGTCDTFMRFQTDNTDPEKNANFVTDLEDWSRISERLYIWDYTTDFACYHLPFPNLEVLGPNLRFFIDHNVKGVFEEGCYPKGGGGYLAELEAYVLAKLMWDPSLDESLLIDEFIAGVYGCAAPIMKRIFQSYRDEIVREDAHLFFCTRPETVYTDPVMIAETRRLFGQALTAAENETVLHEVRKAELWQRFLELSHAPCSEERNAAIDRYIEDCKSFGIGQINEWTDIDSAAAKMKE